MNTPHSTTSTRPALHPMMILAALAVILFCLAGTAAIMGWIPSSVGGNAPNRELTEADRLALSAQMLPVPAASALAPSAGDQRYALADTRNAEPAARYVEPETRYVEPESRPLARDVAPRRAEPERAPVKVASATPAKKWCSNCGNIESIRAVTTRAEGSGLGAAGGAVLGGLLGSQIGGGNGKKLATVAGAVGGAVVGNQVEGNMKATTSYEIRVRLDDGSARTFRQQSEPQWRTGQRVKVVNGALRSVS